MRKLIASLLTLGMLFTVFSGFCESEEVVSLQLPASEQEAYFQDVQPLADLTVFAAVRCADVPYEIALDTVLSDRFAEALFARFERAGKALGLSDRYLSDTTLEDTWLSNHFTAAHALPTSAVHPVHEDEYVGVLMISCQTDESGEQLALLGEVYAAPVMFGELTEQQLNQVTWLDTRIIMTFLKDDQSSVGWKVQTLQFEEDALSSDTDVYSPLDDWHTYFDEQHGFSMLYPAIFSEDTLQASEDGVHASLPDASASMSIQYVKRDQQSLADVLASLQSQYADLSLQTDETEESAYCQASGPDSTTIILVKLSKDGVITVTLRWNHESGIDLSGYAGVMLDSLVLDTNSNG